MTSPNPASCTGAKCSPTTRPAMSDACSR
jgi:hypothetical protein